MVDEPDEYEVGMADLDGRGFWGFCVRGPAWEFPAGDGHSEVGWLLGDAVGHMRQMVVK